MNVLLRLPDLLLATFPVEFASILTDPLRLYYLFSLDLFGLVVLLALVPYTSGASRFRGLVAGSIIFLLVYQTYDAFVVSTLHRDPLFYADLSHILGAVYLLWNAALPLRHLVVLLATTGLLALLAWGLPPLLREMHRRLSTPTGRRGTVAAAVVVGALVCIAIVTDRGAERKTYQTVCLSTAQCVVHNVQASLNLRHDLLRRREGPADSTYGRYRTLRWSQPPSLYLVVIESYGSVLTTPPHRSSYNRFMARVEDTLGASGWHAATTRSEAPVFGGLSWLSAATLLLGTPVEHQPTFEVLQPTLSRYPHLVRLLRRQGYETGVLQPPVRSRPGMTVRNLYGFDRTFYLRDLDYRGPAYGWGIVPDQYSLAVAHEQFVAPAENPFFLFFETVAPHGPSWERPPPPLVEDPATLNASPMPRTASGPSLPGRSSVTAETEPPSQLERLFRHVRYDWRVLTEYLRTQAPPNSLVVVVGDHQPYAVDTQNFTTPIHVLSRDEGLVRRFEAYGFRPGLRSAPTVDPLHHAGLYSMLVRVLTAHDRASRGHPVAPLPPYHPRGVVNPALLPDRS